MNARRVIGSTGFCPRCGAQKIILRSQRSWRCDACAHEWDMPRVGGLAPRRRRLSPAQELALLLDKVEGYLKRGALDPAQLRALEARFGAAAVASALRGFGAQELL